MKITILSMFPKTLSSLVENPLVQRAINLNQLELSICDIKDYTEGSYRKIDDSPYGGGKGMILRVDALCNALNSVKTNPSHVILFSPKGAILNQNKVKELSKRQNLVLVCGHYEGVDARFEDYVNEQISIGDYILSGGENAAAVLCDCIVRLLPEVLKDGCAEEESFENNLLEHKQYSHPLEFEGKQVPNVLLSGNDKEVALYKEASAIIETIKYRPDLLFKAAEIDSIGLSKSSILKFENFVLKVNASEREYEVYKWLANKVKTPKIVDFYKNNESYLLMEKVTDNMLCSDYFYKRPELLIKTVCEALNNLWNIDISDCPFDSSPETKLKLAKENIDNGLVEMDPDNGFDSPKELYTWLCKNKPKTFDRVFSHGDFCLPNIFASKKGKITYIDVGLAGIGDRYCDIAICLRSLKRNADGKYNNNIKVFDFDHDYFFKELGIEPDLDKIKWYTLLNELF